MKYLDMLEESFKLDLKSNNNSHNKNNISTLNSLIKTAYLTNENILVQFNKPKDLRKLFLEQYSSGSKYSKGSRFNFIVQRFNTLIEPEISKLTSLAQAILMHGRKKYGHDKTITTISRLITNEMKVDIGEKTVGKWMRGSMSITSNQQNVNRLNDIETIIKLKENTLVEIASINASYVKVAKRDKKARSPIKEVVWGEIPESFRIEFEEFVRFKTTGEVCALKKKLGKKASKKLLPDENTWSKRDDGLNGSAKTFKSQVCAFIGFLIHDNDVSLTEINSLSILTNWDFLDDYYDYRLSVSIGNYTTARFFSTLTSNCHANGFFQTIVNPLNDSYLKEYEVETWQQYIEDLNNTLLIPNTKVLDKLHEKGMNKNNDSISNIRHMLPGDGRTYEDTIETCNAVLKNMEQRLDSLTAPLYRMTKSRSIMFLRLALYRPLRITNFCSLKLKLKHEFEELNTSESYIVFNSNQDCWQINVPKEAFKNRNGKSCKALSYMLSPKLNPHIKKYLRIRSDYLEHKKNNSEYFFIDSSCKRVAENSLGNMLKEHTLEAIISYYESENIKYSRFISGINAHATRHIAASIYLDKRVGDVIGAALLLNDNIQTVIDTYIQTDTEKYQNQSNLLFDSLYN
jgi:hypothetical protein